MAILRTAVLVAMLVVVPAAHASEVVDRIVAVVNGEIITLFEVNEHLKPYLNRFKGRELTSEDKAAIKRTREELLNKMVEEKLLDQQVKMLGVTVSDTEVETELESIRNRNKLSAEQFEEQLKLEGLTLEAMKKRIGDDILKHRLLGFMVKRKVVVSDEEVREYYESNKSSFVKGKQVDLSVILSPTLDAAQELRSRILKGELTFADAAQLYSQGPGASQGGGLGTMQWIDIAPDWRDALVDVAEGGLSEAFDFKGFGAILKLNGVGGGDALPFEAVEKEIRNTLYQRQLDVRLKEYMQELRSNAVIEMKL